MLGPTGTSTGGPFTGISRARPDITGRWDGAAMTAVPGPTPYPDRQRPTAGDRRRRRRREAGRRQCGLCVMTCHIHLFPANLGDSAYISEIVQEISAVLQFGGRSGMIRRPQCRNWSHFYRITCRLSKIGRKKVYLPSGLAAQAPSPPQIGPARLGLPPTEANSNDFSYSDAVNRS